MRWVGTPDPGLPRVSGRKEATFEWLWCLFGTVRKLSPS
jgi:hypothetical protein